MVKRVRAILLIGACAVLAACGNGTADRKLVPAPMVAQPACAEFLCRKLYRFFVSEAAAPDAL